MGALRASVLVGCVLFVACPSAEPPSSPPAPPAVTKAPFDVTAIVRRVERAFRRDGEHWATRGAGFSVRHSSAGLELIARHRPDEPLRRGVAGPQRLVESAPVRLGPARLERGGWKASADGLAATQSDDGTVWLRGAGWAEHLQNEDVGLEQSWHVERLPGEAGDLVVTVPVHGAAHRAATASGEHLVDPTTGLGFLVGHGTLIDADHRETTVPVRFEAGALVLRVPEALLKASRFPVVLDPLISPEFDVDEPAVSPGAVRGGAGGVSVASNGSGYLVAWADDIFGVDICAARVDTNGHVIDRAPLLFPLVSDLFPMTEDVLSPVVASNGNDYLLVWAERQVLRATRISASGLVLDPQPLLISTDSGVWFPVEDLVSVTSNGPDYLVAWNSITGLKVARVTTAGVVLDPQGLPLSPFGEPLVSIISSGTGYLALFSEPNPTWSGLSVKTTFIERDGGVGPSRTLASIPGSFRHPWLASSDAGVLATWSRWDGVTGHHEVEGMRLSPTGIPVTTAPLALSAGACTRFAKALGAGEEFLVSWVGCDGTLVASTLSPDGSVRSPMTVLASSVQSTSIASSGASALIAFDSAGTPRAQVLELSGRPLDAGVVFTFRQDRQKLPSVATIGNQSLVVWDNEGSIFGARVTHAGTQLDPSRIEISRGRNQVFGTVATNGTEYFVVWLDFQAGLSAPTIRGARISTQGVVLDDGGTRLTTESGVHHMPRVASNGSSYLVAWGSSGNLLATRVSRAGVVLDTPALRHTRNVAYGETPSVASDGTDFLVVWSTNTPDGGLDITGSRITAGGSILDPQGLPITNSPVFEVGPVLASNSDTYLVAWEENERRPAQRYRYFPYALAFENERIRGALLTRTGGAHDAGVLLLSPPSGERSSAGIGTNGTDYLVAWQDKRSNPSFDLYGARVTADGLVQDVDGGFLISGRYQHEVLPTISATGNGDYLVAYSQHTGRWTSWRVKARVLDVNGPPVPTTLRLTTTEEAPLALSLTATDPENDALTFSIRRPPSHGTLTGTPPQLVYTPAPDFSGVDDLEFRVTDGTSTSRPGLVSLTVTPVNDAPTVEDLELSFRQGDAIAFTLPARDVDQDALQYRLVSQPSSGLLGGTPPTLTWQPPAGFRGTASVRFRVSDGVLDGPREGAVRWTVTNGPPTVSASAMPAMTTEGEPVRFVATASDPGHDSLALSWDFGDGATAQGETVTHVYEGTGRFRASVTASDGLARTTRTLDVDVVNGAPRLRVSMPVVASEGEVVSLRAEVMDGQATAALVEWQFSDGSPAVQGAAVTHLFPDDGRFTVTVLATDALGATRRVERDISVFNVSPTPATPTMLQVRAGERATTTLTATDPAGARDALTWTLLRGPGGLTSAGVYEWPTTATDTGRFSIEAHVADDDEGAAVVRFDVDVLPSSSAPMGCACTSASGGVDLLLVAWAMRRWRRRQVRASQVTPAPPCRG